MNDIQKAHLEWAEETLAVLAQQEDIGLSANWCVRLLNKNIPLLPAKAIGPHRFSIINLLSLFPDEVTYRETCCWKDRQGNEHKKEIESTEDLRAGLLRIADLVRGEFRYVDIAGLRKYDEKRMVENGKSSGYEFVFPISQLVESVVDHVRYLVLQADVEIRYKAHSQKVMLTEEKVAWRLKETKQGYPRFEPPAPANIAYDKYEVYESLGQQYNASIRLLQTLIEKIYGIKYKERAGFEQECRDICADLFSYTHAKYLESKGDWHLYNFCMFVDSLPDNPRIAKMIHSFFKHKEVADLPFFDGHHAKAVAEVWGANYFNVFLSLLNAELADRGVVCRQIMQESLLLNNDELAALPLMMTNDLSIFIHTNNLKVKSELCVLESLYLIQLTMEQNPEDYKQTLEDYHRGQQVRFDLLSPFIKKELGYISLRRIIFNLHDEENLDRVVTRLQKYFEHSEIGNMSYETMNAVVRVLELVSDTTLDRLEEAYGIEVYQLAAIDYSAVELKRVLNVMVNESMAEYVGQVRANNPDMVAKKLFNELLKMSKEQYGLFSFYISNDGFSDLLKKTGVRYHPDLSLMDNSNMLIAFNRVIPERKLLSREAYQRQFDHVVEVETLTDFIMARKTSLKPYIETLLTLEKEVDIPRKLFYYLPIGLMPFIKVMVNNPQRNNNEVRGFVNYFIQSEKLGKELANNRPEIAGFAGVMIGLEEDYDVPVSFTKHCSVAELDKFSQLVSCGESFEMRKRLVQRNYNYMKVEAFLELKNSSAMPYAPMIVALIDEMAVTNFYAHPICRFPEYVYAHLETLDKSKLLGEAEQLSRFARVDGFKKVLSHEQWFSEMSSLVGLLAPKKEAEMLMRLCDQDALDSTFRLLSNYRILKNIVSFPATKEGAIGQLPLERVLKVALENRLLFQTNEQVAQVNSVLEYSNYSLEKVAKLSSLTLAVVDKQIKALPDDLHKKQAARETINRALWREHFSIEAMRTHERNMTNVRCV